MKNILSLIQYILITLVLLSVILFLLSWSSTFVGIENVIRFTGILIWPFVVILIALFFQKMFAYLFFSMERFNFFGAHGNIKPVQEMIQEEAEKLKFKEDEDRRISQLKKEFGQMTWEAKEQKIGGITLSELIELFIALEIISGEKAEQARSVLSEYSK